MVYIQVGETPNDRAMLSMGHIPGPSSPVALVICIVVAIVLAYAIDKGFEWILHHYRHRKRRH